MRDRGEHPHRRASMDAIRRRMATRALTPGERLPSIRGLAATHGACRPPPWSRPMTGSRPKARSARGRAPASMSPARCRRWRWPRSRPRLDRAIDPLWVSRQSLDAGAETARSPAAAGCRPTGCRRPRSAARSAPWPGPTTRRWPTTARRAACSRCGTSWPGTWPTTGSRPGRRPDPAHRVGHAGHRPVCRFLLQPGDTVLVDDPCYFNFQALLRAHRAKIVGVPYTPTGPDPDPFAEALAAHRPRLYITNSALHNPTGATLSPADRASAAERGGGPRPHHRRGRHLRRFRARTLAAARGPRRAGPRDPDRQLLQDAVGLDPLRLHRGARRLDRGPDRPPGRHRPSAARAPSRPNWSRGS